MLVTSLLEAAKDDPNGIGIMWSFISAIAKYGYLDLVSNPRALARLDPQLWASLVKSYGEAGARSLSTKVLNAIFKFDQRTLPVGQVSKVTYAGLLLSCAEAIRGRDLDVWLQVDGGVTLETIERCAEAGADVTERSNAAQRGKGYALDHGVRQLERDPPDLVVIVDADCIVAPQALERMFGDYGKTARIPMLWIYTENDMYFGPELPRQWHAAYVATGGQAQLVQFPPQGDDGHLLFSRFPQLWQPKVAEFLDVQGFPATGKDK